MSKPGGDVHDTDARLEVIGVTTAISRIAQAMDAAPSVSDVIALLTPDIHWAFSAGTAIDGAAAVADWVASRRASHNQGPESGTRHVVTNVVVDVTGADSASARSYFCYYGTADGKPVLNAVGSYDDEFSRFGGRWLLASRLITV